MGCGRGEVGVEMFVSRMRNLGVPKERVCLRELSVVAECGNGQTTDSRNSVSEPLSMGEFPEPPELVTIA